MNWVQETSAEPASMGLGRGVGAGMIDDVGEILTQEGRCMNADSSGFRLTPIEGSAAIGIEKARSEHVGERIT